MENTKLCPPLINYFRQMAALFREDPDIQVTYKEEKKTIELLVKGTAKAEALHILLNDEKAFGNETVRVVVKPSNQKDNIADLYRDAFAGNLAVMGICENNEPFESTHILFKPKVVQYVNDDISDLNGIHSTLYQYLADKVFYKRDGVFFNTVPVVGGLGLEEGDIYDDDFFDDDDDDDGGYDE